MTKLITILIVAAALWGGWQLFVYPRKFKNQGDCVSFVETGR